eukprot:g2354.t1
MSNSNPSPTNASVSRSRKHYRSRFWNFPRKLSARTFQCIPHRENQRSLSPLPSISKGKARSEGGLSTDEDDEEEEIDRKTVDQLELSRMSTPHVSAPNCLRISDTLILSNSSSFASLSAFQMNKEKQKVTPKLRKKNSNTTAEAEGHPPAGYLWIWMGVLRRWHRNHFLLETPGVLTHSRIRGSQMKGAFCLRDARVIASHGHSRQFCIVSPAGVAYFRSLRKDQRGSWISSLRASIEKYTQCIQQAERVTNGTGSLVYCEPEQAKLALEVKSRSRALVLELDPYKESLKKHLNQISKQVLSVQELLGDQKDTEASERRSFQTSTRLSTEGNNGIKKVATVLVTGQEEAEKARLMRHPSLKEGFNALQRNTSSTEEHTRLNSARSVNLSADDLLLSKRSVPLEVLTEDSTRISKSLTPRPSTNSRRNYVQYSPTVSQIPDALKTAATESSSKKDNRTNSINRVSDLGSPFLQSNEEPVVPVGTTLWSSYHNFIRAVENTIQKEVQAAMQLKLENSALRKMLQSHHQHVETQVNGDLPSQLISGSTSRSYSTAESEFDVSLLENSDDDPESFEVSTSLTSHSLADIAEDKQSQEELLDALDVVRRADYVTRNSSKNVALVVNFSNASLPKQYEDDDDDEDSESQLENEDSCEFSGISMTVRTRLPAPQPIQRGFNIWSVLKNAIGRDLTRITMPATINEPLSALQRLVEDFEHVSFLRRAAFCTCPNERLLYITAFVLSSYNAGLLRDCKPFNPLLGETFEWSNDHIQFLGEQVSHHPPVSCFTVRGFDAYGSGELIYEVHGELELRSKFWGTTINVLPTGRMELFLATTNERFVWNKACISIHNVILGQLWLDFHGEILIRNLTNGGHAKLRLAKARGPQLDRGNLEGKIIDKSGEEMYTIEGNFTNSVYAKKQTMKTLPLMFDKDEIFHAVELPTEAAYQYNMTPFAVGLNQLTASQRQQSLPKTDSRFRPDVRGLEEGSVNFASNEKLRLEEKQRQARKARKGNGQKYIPMWFSPRRPHDDKEYVRLVDSDDPPVWQFRDEYWTRKANKNWAGCPDIY